MDWLVDIFSGSGFGAVTGLVGGLLSKFTELKAKKAEFSFNLRMAELSLKESMMEHNHELAIADKHLERAQVEGELQVERAEVGAFTESIKNANNVTGFLRYVRPAITAYILIGSTFLFGVVWTKVGGLEAFSASELNDLLKDMIQAVLFLAITTTSWWFASRGGNLIGDKK
ncbi:MAG: hypothetical protein OEX12_01150 [Gammaproteobacteria bacterium]|nr:hypothetical protein [Gammaproteobacteria bacterium]